jgi:4'-phosphopantetheinyl transferase EntD
MRLCHHFVNEELECAVCEFGNNFAELSLLCGDASLVEYALTHFKSESRRCEWLAARMLIRELRGDSAVVLYTPEGKPLLADASEHISISHTEGYVAVAFHKHSDVGVDIERRGEKILKLRRRFMSVAEEDALDRADEQTSLLLHWSAKEAFYKIIGNRGGSFFENFLISPFRLSDGGSFHISYNVQGFEIKRTEVAYVVTPSYVLTFCVAENLPKDTSLLSGLQTVK